MDYLKYLATIRFFVLASALLMGSTSVNADFSFTHNGHAYDVITNAKSWSAALADAKTRTIEGTPGYLARIDDSAENSAIFNQLRDNIPARDFGSTSSFDGGDAAYVWIGANDRRVEGSWIWEDNQAQFWSGNFTGSPVGGLYNNWGNEPDNFDGQQNAAAIGLTEWPLGDGFLGSAGQWNDVKDSNNLYYIVEFPVGDTVPAAPTDLFATPGDGQAVISFSAGLDNGSPITNYQFSLNGGTGTALSPADAISPITIPGLTNGTTYSITLSAINSFGPSVNSSEAVVVAPAGPGPGPGPSLVNLSGNIETVVSGGQGAEVKPVCAMALASGEFMFSCDPIGEFSLENLPREADGTVVRQIYADGFFPSVTTLTESGVETVTLDRAFNCPSYNLPSNPDVIPASAGKMHSIAGRVLLQATDTPICALVLANGAYVFSCDEEGTYSLEFPLDANGQYKLQVYADGFAPAVQTFNEFDDPLNVRMARSSECEADTSVTLYSKRFGFSESFNKAPFPYALTASLSGAYSGIPTPTTASLGIFKLLALGQNFTISNLSATDSSGRVSPYFTVLSNGYDLADGEEVEFELVSPLTRGATVNLNFQYEIQETGDTFSSSYIFSSN